MFIDNTDDYMHGEIFSVDDFTDEKRALILQTYIYVMLFLGIFFLYEQISNLEYQLINTNHRLESTNYKFNHFLKYKNVIEEIKINNSHYIIKTKYPQRKCKKKWDFKYD